MNLHDYQAKTILSNFDVPIQRGMVTDKINEVEDVAKSLNHETGTEWFVVKAQIHAGGRGKGGGVKVAKSIDELKNFSSDILGMMLKTPQTPKEGKLVQKIFRIWSLRNNFIPCKFFKIKKVNENINENVI